MSETDEILVDGIGRSRRSEWSFSPMELDASYYLVSHEHSVEDVTALSYSIKTFWSQNAGRLLLLAESYRGKFDLCAYGSATPTPFTEEGQHVWEVPQGNTQDFPWLCAVDETLTVAAVGTARGRIWLYDLASKRHRNGESSHSPRPLYGTLTSAQLNLNKSWRHRQDLRRP